MRINHNIAALNTHRQLGQANQANQNSMEKLSSGLRINNASDDAAGLAISEKMRGQIRGLEQAQTNAQDGISMIQTAEGAMNESHSILQRMRELAVQSSNDTNTSTDREELQKEVDQLSEELTRIGDNTEFNTQNLLDGSFEGTFQIGANEGQNLSVEINDMRGFELGVAGDVKGEETIAVTDGDGTQDIADGTYSVMEDPDNAGTFQMLDGKGTVVAESSDKLQYTAVGGDDTFTFTNEVDSGEITIENGNATGAAAFENKGLEAGDYSFEESTGELTDAQGDLVGTINGTDIENADGDVLMSFETAAPTVDMNLTVGGIDISSQSSADSAITKINDAIESVSSERSKLGAVQNRLDHTINNLGTSSENLTAAESRIRDVDMAKEMMNQTKQNILSQASQSMLAKANQQPQGVLQLLR